MLCRYIGSAMEGLGFGQVLPVIVSIIVLTISPPTHIIGIACLSFALLIILIMIILYAFLCKSSFYRHHSGLDENSSSSLNISNLLTVLRSTWIYFFVVFFEKCLTLSVHPALTALIKPVSTDVSPWNDVYFVPVCCFLVQSLGDWIGKTTATATQWPKPGKWTEVGVAIVAVARIAFIPLMLRCNVAPLNRSTEILFLSDLIWVVLLTLFSLTGGYLSNVGMMLGPKKVGLELQETAGMILTTALVTGLGVGSTLGPSIVTFL